MAFRVTANQVTFARLCAIPFLAALLYGGTAARWAAMVLGIAIGLTDTLDGYLARKHGPTLLGGLMDPIADKVFVATALLPLADIGWAPWWLVHAVLLREFLVTALRSSFEIRHRTLRSTYLAKVKTWVQMLVLAIAVAVRVVPTPWMTGVFIALPVLALASALIASARGRFWRGMWIFFGSFTATTAVYLAFGGEVFLTAMFAATAIITWASALDYLALAVRELRHPRAGDLARVAGAAAVPIVATLVLERAPVFIWAVIAVVAIEVAHGGLDNLLAHDDAVAPAWAWAARSLGSAALLGAGLVWPHAADLLSLAALTVTLAGTAAEFWRHRRHYLDDRPPRKRPVTTPAAVRTP